MGKYDCPSNAEIEMDYGLREGSLGFFRVCPQNVYPKFPFNDHFFYYMVNHIILFSHSKKLRNRVEHT